MKKLLAVLTFAGVFIFLSQSLLIAQSEQVSDTTGKHMIEKPEHDMTDHAAVNHESNTGETHAFMIADQDIEAHHDDENNNGHGADMAPLFFIIMALLIGALVRHLLRKTPLPFTVWLLIIGLAIGIMGRMGWFIDETTVLQGLKEPGLLHRAFTWAGNIDPHIIMYVFLPTLIFEAAFAMDVHTFKKSAVNATLLAIPGIIIAMFLTGLIMIAINKSGYGLEGWNWSYALMFGAVASATDPVAVVALLKELGASKKLGTLIEGESMLNDGTAIVLFVLFLGMVTGEGSSTSPVLEFLKVAVGGILVGAIIGSIAIRWVRKVFNDALVEISVIVAAAYLTFFLAETLHVSGVLGLVTLGLAMASIGKTRISPEVGHFLHEFWELFAFIANTLIFIIVGVVIAEQSAITTKNVVILLLLYVCVHIIRALVILLFYPIMRKAGYGLPKRDAIIVWYGALRGAVGLALALIVAANQAIPEEIRGQFLFFTAGLVTLTLLVNATTIKPIVNKLGLTKVSPAKRLIQINARKYLYNSSINALEKTKTNRYLSRANWSAVEAYLPKAVDQDEGSEIKIDTIAEYRRRILEKEKSSYWHQFKEGLLSPTSVMNLSDTIQKILDEGGMIPLSQRKDLEENWKTGKWLDYMQRIPLLSNLSRKYFFEQISVSYDSARGFVQAQEDALKLIERMVRGLEAESIETKEKDMVILDMLEEEITENRMLGQQFLRNLRKNYPEIYTAVATRQAIRTLLNYEKHTVERMQKNGQLESGEAHKIIEEIEERMKRLMNSPPVIDQPESEHLLKESILFHGIDAAVIEDIATKFHARIYSVGDRLIKEHAVSDGLYFIARGRLRVAINNKDVEILSRGEFIGEIACLTGSRTADVFAESPATVFFLPIKEVNRMLDKYPDLADRIWSIGASRISFNFLQKTEPYNHWKQDRLGNLIKKGSVYKPNNLPEELQDKLLILISGTATGTNEKKIDSPALLETTEYSFDSHCRFFVC